MAGIHITPGKTGGKPSAKSSAPQPLNPATAWKAAQGDPTYQATRGALENQLTQYGTNLKSQGTRYDQQYGEDLGNLGAQDAHGVRFSTPADGAYNWKTTLAKTGDAFAGGITTPTGKQPGNVFWNQIDPSTASGKAFTDQANDYAARGMTQSSGHAADLSSLGRGLTQQLGDAALARENYIGDLRNQSNAYVGQTSDTLNQAKLQALATYNNQWQTNATRAAAGIKVN